MANRDNLIPNSERTPSELREMTQKGGIASGERRREKQRIRAALEKALSGMYEVDEGLLEGYEAIAVRMVREALGGNVQAFKEIRDSVGEKPTTAVDLSSSDERVDGLTIAFVDKTNHRKGAEPDPKIVGEYTKVGDREGD